MTIAENQSETSALELKVAKRLHPEDICVGDDIALSEVAYQYLSFHWCGADATILPPERPVRVTFLPPHGDNQPLKIKSVCLPFVLCETVNGKHKLYDVRQIQFVKLDSDFAQKVRDAFNEKKESKKKSKRKRKKKSD